LSIKRILFFKNKLTEHLKIRIPTKTIMDIESLNQSNILELGCIRNMTDYFYFKTQFIQYCRMSKKKNEKIERKKYDLH